MALKVLVSAEPLARLLSALNGPSHCIRELQFTRDKEPILSGNPIDALIKEYKAAVETQHAYYSAAAIDRACSEVGIPRTSCDALRGELAEAAARVSEEENKG